MPLQQFVCDSVTLIAVLISFFSFFPNKIRERWGPDALGCQWRMCAEFDRWCSSDEHKSAEIHRKKMDPSHPAFQGHSRSAKVTRTDPIGYL